MKQLDLGSANGIRLRSDEYEGYGIDVTNYNNIPNFEVCDPAIEPLPFPDDYFDLVTAYDFLEHIPPILYLPTYEYGIDADGHQHAIERRACMIELFNEIYRVLKDGGEFYHQTPGYHPDANIQSVWADPTHVYVWTPETAHHFSGDYTGWHDHYGHTSKFKLISSEFVNNHFYESFKAIKPCEPPYDL